MLEFLKDWYKARFSDPQAITLVFILLGIALTLYFAAGLLAPLLIALVLAFLLEWPVAQMEKLGVNRAAGASIVLVIFLGLMLVLLLVLMPSVWKQGVSLVTEMPKMLDNGVAYLREFSQSYPQYISTDQIDSLTDEVKANRSTAFARLW